MLGYRLFRVARSPAKEGAQLIGPLGRALLERGGGPRLGRLKRLADTAGRPGRAVRAQAQSESDPVLRLRRRLIADRGALTMLEKQTELEVSEIIRQALSSPGRTDGEAEPG
jgi:hypothetical protein